MKGRFTTARALAFGLVALHAAPGAAARETTRIPFLRGGEDDR